MIMVNLSSRRKSSQKNQTGLLLVNTRGRQNRLILVADNRHEDLYGFLRMNEKSEGFDVSKKLTKQVAQKLRRRSSDDKILRRGNVFTQAYVK